MPGKYRRNSLTCQEGGGEFLLQPAEGASTLDLSCTYGQRNALITSASVTKKQRDRLVGQRLQELRLRRGITQSQLAATVGITKDAMSRIERGVNGTTLGNLRTFADVLDVDLRDLIDPVLQADPPPSMPGDVIRDGGGRDFPGSVTPIEVSGQYRKVVDSLAALPEQDREEMIRMILWTAERVRPQQVALTGPVFIGNVLPFPSQPDDAGDFPFPPISEEEWIDRDTDIPRPLHAWVKPIHAEVAAGPPRATDDWMIPTTQVLNSLREVRDDRVKVVKIFGDSMYPVLRNGWKVLLDPARSLFQLGKVVMVYIRDEGSTIGMLASHGQAYKIVKRNPNYGGPLEILLNHGEWYPVGTVTTIVEAPVEIE